MGDPLDDIKKTFEDMRATMVRDCERTKKLVETLMSIAETADARTSKVARDAVEEWLKP